MLIAQIAGAIFATAWLLLFLAFACFAAFYCFTTPFQEVKVAEFKLKFVWFFGAAFAVVLVLTTLASIPVYLALKMGGF